MTTIADNIPPTKTKYFSLIPMSLLHLALVIASGALTPLAFAPYRYYGLMPILLAVLIIISEKAPRRAWLWVYLWGLSAYLVQNWWVFISLHEVARLPMFYALLMTLLLPAYLALYPTLAFYVARRWVKPQPLRLMVALPLCWLLSEWLRETLLTGFGWGALGYSQITESPLASLAPIGGIHLVTLAVISIASLLALSILTHRHLYRATSILAMVAIIALSHNLKNRDYTHPIGAPVRVALIQGNIPQDGKFDLDRIADDIQMYYDKVAETPADIVIMPESAIPVLKEMLPNGLLAQFASVAKRNQSALATGIIQRADNNPTGYLNAVINLTDFDPHHQDQPLPYYAKHHLVPFGEFRPLPNLTAPLYRMMHIPLTGFSRGHKEQPLLNLAGQQVAFTICYEDGFGAEMIANAKNATLLANVSNLAWFGSSFAMDLQLQHAQARALEMGRFVVRATNTGYTAVIDPHGQVLAMLARDTRQVLTHQVQGYEGQTPYMRLGGNAPLMLLAALLVALAAAYSRSRHKK